MYEYQQTRNASHPREFLKGFDGICVTDGYQVYHTLEKELEELTIAGCWVHCRRRFDEALKLIPKSYQKESNAFLLMKQIQAIYREEGKLNDLSSEERLKQRQAVIKPLVDAFFAYYLYAYEFKEAGNGWKSAIVTWYQMFKESVFFRKLFFLAFVTSLILFRTLLNRNLWMNPLSDVMGGWGIWETVNGEQKLTTECIENVIMMMPFSAVVAWTFGEKIGNG